VEVLLAAAALPELPPISDLVDADLLDQVPPNLQPLLNLVPKADIYLQDEVQCAHHPTITRVWCRRGRRGQRLVEAPGDNSKFYGFGILDWRDGWFNGAIAEGRTAQPFCDQLKAALARSQTRGRIAIVIADNLKTHTAKGSLLVRKFLTENEGQLYIVYTPPYDPDANRIEWLWRVSRRVVTHNHQRATLDLLQQDAEQHFASLREHPEEVLRHIGSPFVPEDQLTPQRLAA
jgi:transposase